MRIARLTVASLVVLVATAGMPTTASAEVWDDDGGLVFWGRGYTEPTAYEPAFNALDGRTLTQIAGTTEHVCAIDEQGEAVCWGDGDRGRHGTGARNFAPAGPAAVDSTGVLAGKNLVDIDAGSRFTCTLDDTGQAYCWGDGRQGQLGRPDGWFAYTPERVFQKPLPEGVGFVDITTGANHACGLTDEGEVFCWGRGASGQLGNGRRYDEQSPTRVKTGDLTERRLISIDAGSAHTCAVDAAGRAYCWGDGTKGRLGTGFVDNIMATPQRVVGSGATGVPYTDVSAGRAHTCAETQARRLFCWGSNSDHQVSPNDRRNLTEPKRVSVGQVSDFSTGYQHTCAIVEATDVYCWGYNRSGQIGDGSKALAKQPTRVKSPGVGLGDTEPELVQALANMTCGMDAAGDAYCWGDRDTFMPGTSWREALQPRRVADKPTGLDGTTLTDVTDSGFNWCALSSPSQPVCFGNGPLTGSSEGGREKFVDIATAGTFGGDPVHALDTGTQVACALSDAGAAYCWGDGPLGVADTEESSTPIAVETSGVLAGRTLVDISVDESHGCAVDDNGKAFCWGEDNFGEVGNGPDGHTDVPQKVVSNGVLAGENLVAIEASMFNTCALSADAEVFCWGGWLGNGSGTTSQKPVRTDLSPITAGETVTSLHAAYDTPCLLTDAGHAYCWGSSYRGQTGTGSLSRSVTRPTAVVRTGALSGVQLTDLVMPANTTMCGLGTNGRVYCWGDDQYGVLGNGVFNGRSDVPVAVIDDGILDGAVVTDLGAGAGAVWAVTEEAP